MAKNMQAVFSRHVWLIYFGRELRNHVVQHERVTFVKSKCYRGLICDLTRDTLNKPRPVLSVLKLTLFNQTLLQSAALDFHSSRDPKVPKNTRHVRLNLGEMCIKQKNIYFRKWCSY